MMRSVEHHPRDPGVDVELARAVGEAVGGDPDGRGPSRAQVSEILGLARRSAQTAGAKAVASGQWLAELSLEAATHLPIRDLDTLRTHHDGLAGSLLAKPLIRNASLASAAVGATTGALAAASQVNPATWVALPVELAAETIVVVAVEMKLAGELHEAAGYPIAGDLRRSGPVVAKAWADTRGLSPQELAKLLRPGQAGAIGMTASELLGRSARDQLINQIRRRLLRRMTKNTLTFIPMLAGAAVGGELNRRATRTFGLTVARTLAISPP